MSLEQAANLLCAQANSASYPQLDGKWVVAHGLRGEGLVWLIGAVVRLCAAPQVDYVKWITLYNDKFWGFPEFIIMPSLVIKLSTKMAPNLIGLGPLA